LEVVSNFTPNSDNAVASGLLTDVTH
jgi:hypothetical protein